MAEQWKNEATFRTMADEEVHVRITPDWDVFINNEDEPRPNFSGHAAVILGGFVASLDIVIPTSDIYRRADDAYRFAVKNELARPLWSVPDCVTGKEYGKYVQRITKPVKTPFRTNIMQLNASSLRKVLLVCSDTYDDEFARSIIEGSDLSDDESVNAFLIRNLLIEYERKKATGTAIITAKAERAAAKSEQVSDSDISAQDSDKPLSDGLEVDETVVTVQHSDAHDISSVSDDQVTDSPASSEKTPFTDSSQDIAVEKPTTITEAIVVSAQDSGRLRDVPAPESPTVPEYISSSEVIKSVGAHIFEAEAGTIFTEDDLTELIRIDTADKDKIRSALIALTNAGFLSTSVREMGSYYVRLDRPNPKKNA